MPVRERPAVDGTVISGGGAAPGSSRTRWAAARWLTTAPAPQARTAAT